MSTFRRAKLIQAAFGALVLTLLMQPVMLLGYAPYVWVLFLPLLLFFALRADFKAIPSMVVCFIAGQLWAVVNGIVTGALSGILGATIGGLLATVVVIFLMLTTHENLLARTIFSNVPALFLGMALSFFVAMIEPEPAITPFHLTGLYLYGIVLSVVLVLVGKVMCDLILGKTWMVEAGMVPGENTEKAPEVDVGEGR